MKTKNIFLLLFSVILINSCSDSITSVEPGEPGKEAPRQLNSIEQSLVESDQGFSYNLFRNVVAGDQNENVFISPLSLSYALAMTLNGADGETFDQIQETLGLSEMDLNDVNEGYLSLMELLTGIDPTVEMNITNSIWSREGFEVDTSFVNRLETFYKARFSELDFSDPASADIINDWVNEQTRGRIEKIVNGPISSNTVMFLINALFFQGDWMAPFDPEDTQKEDFLLQNGESVEVDMMKQTNRFAAYISDEAAMVELPYGDSLFKMSVIIPGDNSEINDFIDQKVTAENIDRWRSEMTKQEVALELPKFELSYEIELNDVLKNMGMTDAFAGDAADFSGITGSDNDLYVSTVKQKAFVKVDEKGTEASAATSVTIVESVPPAIKADKPFVIIISERTSGANLFIGAIKNPASEI